MKEAHIVNASSVVEAFVNFVKPFLSEKLRKRVKYALIEIIAGRLK